METSYRSQQGYLGQSGPLRKLVRRALVAAAAIVLSLLAMIPVAAAASTASGSARGAAASTGGGPTLRVEADTTFSTFNPFTAYFAADLQVIAGIYPELLQTSKAGLPEPYLATKWTTSANHLTWTFTLRPGLKWTDGTPLTAKDVAWTFDLIMTNPTAGTANGALVANFKSVTAPNPATVVITTTAPQSDMLYLVAGIPVVPEHIWASQVKNLANYRNMSGFPVVGYGPWELTGYVSNQYATLTANKDFYSGPPAYHTLIVQYYSSSDAAVAALRTGALDETDNLTATQYQALKGVKGILAVASQSNIWDAIEINTGARTRSGVTFGNANPALADPVVRKAIALAINRKELVSKVLDGLGVPGAGYLPPAYPQWWWTPPASVYEGYDPAEANAILNAAGYKRGPGGVRVDPKTHKPLVFRFGIHSDAASDEQIAPYIVEWLAAIGIKLTVQAMSFTQLNTVLPKGDWDILMDSWNTGADPSYLLSIQTCATLPRNQSTPGNTDAFFCDPAYDKLYNQQLTEFDTAQRVATVGKMQSLLYQANVDVILYYGDQLEGVRSAAVKNYFYGSPNAQGFYPQEDDFINWLDARPVVTPAPGTSVALVAGVPIVAVVLIGAAGFYALRRRRTAGERE